MKQHTHVQLSVLFGDASLPCVAIADCTFVLQEVKAQTAYIALNSTRVNRQAQIPEVIARGASVIVLLGERFLCEVKNGTVYLYTPDILDTLSRILIALYPHDGLALHGVTGTNGKTTVCWYIASLLDELHPQQCALIGTLGAGTKNKRTATHMTTPEIITLYKLLHQYKQQAHKQVAMEVSAHGIDQGRITGLCFRNKIFTNLGHDHLDYFTDQQTYQQCKESWLLADGASTLVLYADDPCTPNLQKNAHNNGIRTLIYSLRNEHADVYIHNVHKNTSGIKAHLTYQQQTVPIQLAFFGDFNLANATAAITALLADGYDLAVLAQKAHTLTLPPGRMHSVHLPNKAQAIIDYAHTPDALAHLLATIKEHTNNSLVLVFGCGGERDHAKRPQMGRIANQYAQAVWITSDNNRGESFYDIADDIVSYVDWRADLHKEPNRASAIEQALAYTLAEDNRTLIIAGKGHETTQEDSGHIYPFSDEQTLRTAIASYSQQQL